jgi:hypothetical protein
MWPGQEPPGGEQNPQGQYPQGQSPNPYQQPGGPGTVPWDASTVAAGPPQPPRGGDRKTTVTAVVAAAAVVVAAGVTGFLVLGGDKDERAEPAPTGSASGSAPTGSASGQASPNPRAGNEVEPVIPGWKTVVRETIAYDVPPEWGRKSSGWTTYVSDDKDPGDKPLIGFGGVATLKEQWCRSDPDKSGVQNDAALASTGTKTERGARSAAENAPRNAAVWVYGAYAQPDMEKIQIGPAEDYTTSSGLKGSVATATSSGVVKRDKCDTDGRATTFTFKNAQNDFVSWTFVGVRGVKDEVPDATVRKILSTVRLTGAPQTS